jgi:hypothetical protein
MQAFERNPAAYMVKVLRDVFSQAGTPRHVAILQLTDTASHILYFDTSFSDLGSVSFAPQELCLYM